MRTRPTTYLNTKTKQPVFGFQIRHQGQWYNACEGTKPLLFDSESERDAKRKEAARNRAGEEGR